MSTSYAFFSVKGGVGKSALATAAAVAYARTGRAVAVVDGDLSGTSLADGLLLRAPEPLPDGGVAWSGPTRGHRTREETLARRRAYGEERGAPPLPFFDALITAHPRPEFDPAAVAWVHDDVPQVRWYPSSPAPKDTSAAVHAMMRDAAFGGRLVWAVQAIRESLGADGVLLVDLPPGMFGVGTWVAGIEGVAPVLVTTDDRNDLYRSAHEHSRLHRKFPDTRWLLNRSRRAPEDVRADLRGYLGPFAGTEPDFRAVGWHSDLERVFREDRLHVSVPLGERILQLLEDR